MRMSPAPEEEIITTPDSIDPLYDQPVIDRESHHNVPAPHYRVSGHFENTPVRFKFYFPPKDTWNMRFFQLAHPMQSEHATAETIGFGLHSHAYTIQVTGTQGFRAEAAAAKFSRVIAARHYDTGSRRIYGYLYGGSGGSLQVVGAIERTLGIWDGVVPFVQAIPVSAPNNPSVRAMAGLVLRNKAIQIQDALKPGGSGDPFSVLNSVEMEILYEATKLGIPIQAWEDFNFVADTSTLSLLTNSVIKFTDPEYVNDFWTKPGYLGTDPSPLGDVFRGALVSFEATVRDIVSVNVPVSVYLSTEPPVNTVFEKYGYVFTVYASNDVKLGVLAGTFDHANKLATFDDTKYGQNSLALLKAIARGTKMRIDNKRSIAMRAYYRYQVPDRSSFYGFDQFRGPDGSSIFPRRPYDASKQMSEGTSGGGTHSGNIKGKVIVIQNLMDSDAFPWHADWYRRQVQQAVGASVDINYRLWYNENTEHDYEGPKENRSSLVVPYRGICQRALLDLSAWVEKDVQPPDSTSYTVAEDSSIQLPPSAAERRGIQPTVRLTVDGGSKAKTKTGKAVTFRAIIEAPPGAGKIVSVEWDFFGNGRYSPGRLDTPNPIIDVESTFAYSTAGSYIAGVRATCQCEGELGSAYARVMNMSRVSVEVAKFPYSDMGKVYRL